MSTQETRRQQIKRLVNEEGHSVDEVALMLGLSRKTVANRLQESRKEVDVSQPAEECDEAKREIEKFGVQREIDGKTLTHKSTRLLEMSETDDKDPDYLLTAHKYDPAEWELLGSKSKIWNVYSKDDYVVTLYSSSITVKPKAQTWTYGDLLTAVKSVPAIHIPDGIITNSTNRMLEIPLYDTHFGISDIEHYRDTLSDTLDHIRLKTWEQIEITIGQDLLHNDNFRGTTASGTPIEAVNMPNAWGDALKLYAPIVAVAKKQAQSVKIIYSKGNHDESMSWAFVQNLRSLFPWAIYDHEVHERKVHMFHHCFVGITHGDKTPPRELVTLFATEFPEQWAQATTREIHKGHWHKEDANDDFGSMVRTLATRNKTDLWHKNKGFTKAHKRFQLFEWDHNELKHIHYV
jgi:predicted transcriptional regulator